MSRLIAGLVGSVQEAWQELRIHKTRVMLSLIGVAVAVCSLATTVAMGDVLRQSTAEMNERYMGRPATLTVMVEPGADGNLNSEQVRESWDKTIARYKIKYATRTGYAQRPVQDPDGVRDLEMQLVDVPYGEMRRVRMVEGTWFTAEDVERQAPAVVVTKGMWRTLGSPPLDSHPTFDLLGHPDTTVVIIGVADDSSHSYKSAMMLVDAYLQLPDPIKTASGYFDSNMMFNFEMWIPPEKEEEVKTAVQRDMAADLGDSVRVRVDRTDSMQGGEDPGRTFAMVMGAIAMLVLLLGALGLLNISLVTVKQRVREIGIRRASGATAGRIFFSVMMESVVATVAAGTVGVMAAIVIMRSPITNILVGDGMLMDTPAFPVSAAILGMASATIIGALAGLIPALYAVRVKVIDAIRF